MEKLNLSRFYSSIKAVLDKPGRPTTDPEVLLALWVLATVEGVGSARKLARLCQEHDAYRWLCGGVPINYHMLSDFRVAHQVALDDLLTQIVASLMAADAVTLEQVAQDGMRVRASAGGASFHRRDRLEACWEAARKQVERLAEERDHPDPGVKQRERAARERAARERVQRVEKALEYLPQVEATKGRQQLTKATRERSKVTEARIPTQSGRMSTTDPEARVMKMPDGGFRPAYNVQLATDKAKGIIVGVAVTAEGTDAKEAPPMEAQVEKRTGPDGIGTGEHPKAYLMDGGFATRDSITSLEKRSITVYAPVRQPRNRPETERYQARYEDTPEVVAWRRRIPTQSGRMATQEAQAVYKGRGATAESRPGRDEWVNAQIRQHGVSQFTVRGLVKVTTVMLLVAVAHNLMRWATLVG